MRTADPEDLRIRLLQEATDGERSILLDLFLREATLTDVNNKCRLVPEPSDMAPSNDHGVELISLSIQQDALRQSRCDMVSVIRDIDILFHNPVSLPVSFTKPSIILAVIPQITRPWYS